MRIYYYENQAKNTFLPYWFLSHEVLKEVGGGGEVGEGGVGVV